MYTFSKLHYRSSNSLTHACSHHIIFYLTASSKIHWKQHNKMITVFSQHLTVWHYLIVTWPKWIIKCPNSCYMSSSNWASRVIRRNLAPHNSSIETYISVYICTGTYILYMLYCILILYIYTYAYTYTPTLYYNFFFHMPNSVYSVKSLGVFFSFIFVPKFDMCSRQT